MDKATNDALVAPYLTGPLAGFRYDPLPTGVPGRPVTPAFPGNDFIRQYNDPNAPLPGLAPLGGGDVTNGGTVTVAPPTDPGWTKYIPFAPGNPLGPLVGNPGTQGDPGQPPGSTFPPTPGAAPAAPVNTGNLSLNWLQEAAIRAMMVLVGITLIGGGLYLAGSRARNARTIADLVPTQTRI